MTQRPHPRWGPDDLAGPVVEQATDADAYGNFELVQMTIYPAFLVRVAHSDEQHVGLGGVDLFDHSRRNMCVLDVAVVVAGEFPAAECTSRVFGGFGDRVLLRSEQVVAVALAAGVGEEAGRQVGPIDVVLQASTVQEPRCPAHARTVAKDEVGALEDAAVVGFLDGQVECVRVDVVHAVCPAVPLEDESLEQVDGVGHGQVGDLHA